MVVPVAAGFRLLSDFDHGIRLAVYPALTKVDPLVYSFPLPLVAVSPAPLVPATASNSGARALPVLDLTQLWNPPNTSVDLWVTGRVLVLFQDVAWPSADQLASMAAAAGGQMVSSSVGAKVRDVKDPTAREGSKVVSVDWELAAPVWRHKKFLVLN
jgi:hypothetical protein